MSKLYPQTLNDPASNPDTRPHFTAFRANTPDALAQNVNDFFRNILQIGRSVRCIELRSAGDGATYVCVVTDIPNSEAGATDVAFVKAFVAFEQVQDARLQIQGAIGNCKAKIIAATPTAVTRLIRESMVAGGGAGVVWMVGLLAEVTLAT